MSTDLNVCIGMSNVDTRGLYYVCVERLMDTHSLGSVCEPPTCRVSDLVNKHHIVEQACVPNIQPHQPVDQLRKTLPELSICHPIYRHN